MTAVSINKLEEELIRSGKRKEAFESMLNRFTRQVQLSGVLRDVRKHEYYDKPSVVSRRKHREAVKRLKRKEQKDALHRRRDKGYQRPIDRRSKRS